MSTTDIRKQIYLDRINQCEAIVRRHYTDRLFSQLMRHLYSFFIAKNLGKTHLHWRFSPEIEQNFQQVFDTNLVLDRVYDGEYHQIHQKISRWIYFSLADQDWEKIYRLDWIFNPDNLALFKRAYRLTEHTPQFRQATGIRVALHIRRGDVKSYYPRFTSMSFFVETVQKINRLVGDHPITGTNKCTFLIYSDSSIELDSMSTKDLNNIIPCSNADLLPTMHDMVKADILVISLGSNMSHFAGLLNEGIVYFDQTRRLEHQRTASNNYYSGWSNWTGDPDHLADQISRLAC